MVANGYIADAGVVDDAVGAAQVASVVSFVVGMGPLRVSNVVDGMVTEGAGQCEWVDGCG